MNENILLSLLTGGGTVGEGFGRAPDPAALTLLSDLAQQVSPERPRWKQMMGSAADAWFGARPNTPQAQHFFQQQQQGQAQQAQDLNLLMKLSGMVQGNVDRARGLDLEQLSHQQGLEDRQYQLGEREYKDSLRELVDLGEELGIPELRGLTVERGNMRGPISQVVNARMPKSPEELRRQRLRDDNAALTRKRNTLGLQREEEAALERAQQRKQASTAGNMAFMAFMMGPGGGQDYNVPANQLMNRANAMGAQAGIGRSSRPFDPAGLYRDAKDLTPAETRQRVKMHVAMLNPEPGRAEENTLALIDALAPDADKAAAADALETGVEVHFVPIMSGGKPDLDENGEFQFRVIKGNLSPNDALQQHAWAEWMVSRGGEALGDYQSAAPTLD